MRTPKTGNVVRFPPRIVEHDDGRVTIDGRTADEHAAEAARLRQEADELRAFVARRLAARHGRST